MRRYWSPTRTTAGRHWSSNGGRCYRRLGPAIEYDNGDKYWMSNHKCVAFEHGGQPRRFFVVNESCSMEELLVSLGYPS